MATFSKEIVQRFTHCFHPLTQVSADTEFLCNACLTPGSGTRYRCKVCDLHLHKNCADCPMEISSFMHQHSLKLVGGKPGHVCDMCEDPVEGLFYRCEFCDFNVHPICKELPEYTRHVRHKDHRLRLEISVPIGCMVCKEICSSWRYRCEDCFFHLHLDCTLAPCEEETVMSETKTRSLGTSAPPQPSAWAPAFGGYGYGNIHPPQPQYFAQHSLPSSVHGYRGIPPLSYFAQPSVSPRVHDYGGIVTPHPYYYSAQPSFPSHVYGYGGVATPPPPQYFAQLPFPTHVHGYGGIPFPQPLAQSSFPANAHGHEVISTDHAPSSGGAVQEHGGKRRKRMYAVVWTVTKFAAMIVTALIL